MTAPRRPGGLTGPPEGRADDELLRVHPEVASAVAGGRPVVALESAVITAGLPRTAEPRAWRRAAAALAEPDAWPPGPHRHAPAAPAAPPSPPSPPASSAGRPRDAPSEDETTPLNRLAAARMAEAVRAEGAVPATIAVLDGVLRVGLDAAELDRLAADPGATKASTATLAAALGPRGRNAGTTVSATIVACRDAGVDVFATGGIGGVHRGWTARPDVSADLRAIAGGGVTVVCAGAKSILDVPATIEALEALGVPVVGAGTDVFPRFHAPGEPADRLATRRDDPAEIAALVRRHRRLHGPDAGVLVVRPVPRAAALDEDELHRATEASADAADAAGVTGPDRTPWTLADLARRTDGASLVANLALLVANARLAGALAAAAAMGRPAIHRAGGPAPGPA